MTISFLLYFVCNTPIYNISYKVKFYAATKHEKENVLPVIYLLQLKTISSKANIFYRWLDPSMVLVYQGLYAI